MSWARAVSPAGKNGVDTRTDGVYYVGTMTNQTDTPTRRHEMSTVNEQNCRAALASNLTAGSDLAHEIHMALRKQYDAADGMDVDWGHVGSAGHAAERLREIAEMLGIEVDR